jgi:4-amino-4-deoxy-L-arabinose transferase-like glycosyltransferase
MTLSSRWFWTLFGLALFIRLLSLAGYPLMDTTEARYGEMARLMVETGNWLTPQFDYNVPFWGKPPLFTWISAAGIELFGCSEFAVRFPHWLAGVVTIAFTAYFCKKTKIAPYPAAVVLATCGIFAVASGAVMTDMLLTLSVTLTMLGFYLGWQSYERENSLNRNGRIWGYFGFVGLALGLLAKGPVAIVLVGLAVFPWLLLQHGVKGAFIQLWQRFPIIGGTALMLLIALPWYIAAERATPGFINYFIVGEHFKRFTVSGWQGDLYGSAHNQPRGTIWIYWLFSAAPWSFVLPVLLWKRDIKELAGEHQGIISFLLLWMLSPLLLFSLAGNILPAYILPGIPALAILVALLLQKGDEKWFKVTSLIAPVMLIGALIYLNLGTAEKRSDKALLTSIDGSLPVFYVGKRPFSGQFYSRGKAIRYESLAQLEHVEIWYLIGKSREVSTLIEEADLSCVSEMTAKSKRSRYLCSH